MHPPQLAHIGLEDCTDAMKGVDAIGRNDTVSTIGNVMLQSCGGTLNPVKQCFVFPFPVTVMESFVSAGPIAAVTVNPSFSLSSTTQETASLLVSAQVQTPPVTICQFVLAILIIRSRGSCPRNRATRRTNTFCFAFGHGISSSHALGRHVRARSESLRRISTRQDGSLHRSRIGFDPGTSFGCSE